MRVHKGKAVGVEMADGRVIEAPIIVSGAGVATTAQKLLQPTDAQRAGLLQSLEKVEVSASHLCLYLGYKGNADEEKEVVFSLKNKLLCRFLTVFVVLAHVAKLIIKIVRP